jgi:hypothetical protein
MAVILSEAKDLAQRQILRFAQNDERVAYVVAPMRYHDWIFSTTQSSGNV